jgi:two-component system nitrogen regulation response regulator NtrX
VLGKPGEMAGAWAPRDHGRAAPEARERSSANICASRSAVFSGNISRTASFIGMERSALHRKLKLLGMAETATTVRNDGAGGGETAATH